MVDQKQPENMEYYNCLGSTITREIKFRIAMVKAAFNNKKTQFTGQVDFKFKEETSEMLHLEHIFVWS
jgi:hypothetical protein